MRPSERLSIWLIANTPIVRKGWTLIIENSPALELRDTCSYKEARDRTTSVDCDVAVVDLDLNQDSCWELTRYLKQCVPDLPILVTCSDPPADVDEARRAGADRFVLHSGKNGGDIADVLKAFFDEQDQTSGPVRV